MGPERWGAPLVREYNYRGTETVIIGDDGNDDDNGNVQFLLLSPGYLS